MNERELINWLNARTKEYNEGHPTISDAEWDKRYFELAEIEKTTGVVYPNSPTQVISFDIASSLDMKTHDHLMLSLDKTKSKEEVEEFVGDKAYVAMCKMDGLTCSLRYEGGKLVSAETRGNGIVGENILHNARVVTNIPRTIPYLDTLVVDGEIICAKDDFESFKGEYKNPRNFAAGSIRLLDSAECARRKLQFIAWDVIEGLNGDNLLDNFAELKTLGFTVVPFSTYDIDTAINELVDEAKKYFYPIDGIVFKFNDIEYGRSLGRTSHHFNNAIAYKFADELYETRLIDIDWTMGRTGVLSPVAIFEPVDMDGSTVERANLFNLSVLRETLGLPFKGQALNIYKANMIIPQIHDAEQPEGLCADIIIRTPRVCPVCGGEVVERTDGKSSFLYCDNPNCDGKVINRIDHFCGKKGLDIKGLSKATLEKLMSWGWVSNCIDIFTLSNHKKEWIMKPGFGEKSVTRILEAIEGSRKNCELNSFIAALGIPLIGATVSKDLTREFSTWEEFIIAAEGDYNFWKLAGFGPEMNAAIHDYDFSEAKEIVSKYLEFKQLKISNPAGSSSLDGKTFVITGKLKAFKNRDELKKKIEEAGGKVVGSISSKTSYLVNNDINSTSAKNLAAKKNNIPIISEEQVLEMLS